MRESRTYGSGRGARGNSRPYREGAALLRLLTAAFGPTRKCSRSAPTSAYEGYSGKHLLTLSSSLREPEQTSTLVVIGPSSGRDL